MIIQRRKGARVPTEPIVLDAPADLATGGSAELFSGADHGIDVSFFLNHAAPGSGAEAHRRPPRVSQHGRRNARDGVDPSRAPIWTDWLEETS